MLQDKGDVLKVFRTEKVKFSPTFKLSLNVMVSFEYPIIYLLLKVSKHPYHLV